MPNVLKSGAHLLSHNGEYIIQQNPAYYVPPPTNNIIPASHGQFSIGTFGSSIVLDPAMDRIFVVNFGNNTVSILNYTNPAVVTPTIITQAQGGFSGPGGLAIDPAMNRIFVTNVHGNSISILNYTNPTAGSPTIITTGASFIFNINPVYITLDPASDRIFVGMPYGSIRTVILNYTTPSNATATVSPAGWGVGPMLIDPTSNRFFINGSYIANYTNPFGSSPSNVGTWWLMSGFFINPAGDKIIGISNSNNISSVNYVNPGGGITTIATLAQLGLSGQIVRAITYDAPNQRLFCMCQGGNFVSFHNINL